MVWLTNLAAPYRLPLWEALATDFTLEVALLDGANSVGEKGGHRGEEWAVDRARDVVTAYDFRSVGGPRLRTRSSVQYIGSRPGALAKGSAVVVLAGWESPAYWRVRLACASRSIPCVGFYESTLLSNRYKTGPVAWVRKAYFRSLDRVVAPGPAAAAALRGMGVRPSRILIGFNAVDVRWLHTETARRRESRPGGTALAGSLVVIAQLIPRKNIEAVIDALAMEPLGAARLSVVGKGDLLDELVQRARDRGVSDRVTFVGHVPYAELPDVLAAHSTLVLPSREEVWGLVANEALAAGLHVVVSDRCGVADSIRGMRGVYVTAPSPEAVAAAIAKSLSDWSGPVAEPEILEYTPERFAAVFSAAATQAIDARA